MSLPRKLARTGCFDQADLVDGDPAAAAGLILDRGTVTVAQFVLHDAVFLDGADG